MSRRTDVVKELRNVRAELDDAKREVAEVSGANGRICAAHDETRAALARTHDDRTAAWQRVGELERQLAAQDVMLRTLAEKNTTLLAIVGVMGIGDLEAEVAS